MNSKINLKDINQYFKVMKSRAMPKADYELYCITLDLLCLLGLKFKRVIIVLH